MANISFQRGLAPGEILSGYGGPAALPGYATSATTTTNSNFPELQPKVSANLNTMLGGGLPQDVVDQIHQHAAEFGVASGMPGSEFAGYQGLKNLGLTSLSQSNHATDLLAPGYRSTVTASGNPQGNPQGSGGSPWNQGTIPATLQRPAGGGPAGPAAPVLPATNVVNDFLSKYLPGNRGGTSTGFSSPMGSTSADVNLNPMVPGYGAMQNLTNQFGGQGPVYGGPYQGDTSGAGMYPQGNPFDPFAADQGPTPGGAYAGGGDPQWLTDYTDEWGA